MRAWANVQKPARLLIYFLVIFGIAAGVIVSDSPTWTMLLTVVAIVLSVVLENGVETYQVNARSADEGWYPDELGQLQRHRLRYWDGHEWTRWVVDDGDPYLAREPMLRIDRTAVRHPIWYAIAWTAFYVSAVSIMVMFVDAASDRWASIVGALTTAAILAPYLALKARRRFRMPPRTQPGIATS